MHTRRTATSRARRATTGKPAVTEPVDGGWWSRERLVIVALLAATGLSCWLCYLIARPFFPPIAWALALAVITFPMHTWIAQRVKRPGCAAALSVLLVAIVIVGPAIFVARQAGSQAAAMAAGMKDMDAPVQAMMERNPHLAPVIGWIAQAGPIGSQLEQLAGGLTGVIGGALAAVAELLVTFFLLFYFYRDRDHALSALRSLVPLSPAETEQVFQRVADTMHATIFGTLFVSAIQGTLGGLMFWWLGLPAPLLWGVVMALLAVVPVLGAFVVWLPAAGYLVLQGDWARAAILTAWGTIVIGLIDNLLYPVFVGSRLRFHTVPIFIAMVGGLALFGPSGLILGPVALAITNALIEILRRRTRSGGSVEAGAKQ